jgi:hypothetical protein
MLRPLLPQSPARIKWEEEITRGFIDTFEAARGDAQGMLEAYPNVLDHAFKARLTVDEVAAVWTTPTSRHNPSDQGPLLVLETTSAAGPEGDVATFASVPVHQLLAAARQLNDASLGAAQIAQPMSDDVLIEAPVGFAPWPAERCKYASLALTPEGLVLMGTWSSAGNGIPAVALKTKALPLRVLECLAFMEADMVLYWGGQDTAQEVLNAFTRSTAKSVGRSNKGGQR